MAKLSSYIKSGSLASPVSGFSTVPPLIVGGTTATGTSSQNLQVTGGGYFSSSVGINTVSPIGNLQVNATTSSFVVTGVGSVGIGLTDPRFKLEVGAVGASGTSLYVNGDARVTGILSVGQGTITINGNADKITAPKFEYAGISSTITATAVDVFVYDTRKDSDGGAWRKRTQNTSWYNETLNTATRGSRRDFPAVAVIVGSATALTIYDGDDPDLPMWMVFNRGTDTNPTMLWDGNNANNLTSVSALNGIMMFSTSSAGSFGADFIGERWIYFYTGATTSGFRHNGGGIINRNSAVSSRTVIEQFSTAAAGAQHYDIAMVALPNTPIDSVTGIPFPTIAVGSNNGVNIINSDKTVIATGNSGYTIKKINFTSDYGLNCHIDNSSSSNKALVYVNEFYRISGLSYDTYNNWDGILYATKYDPKALTYRTGGAGSAYPISDFISLGGRQSAIGTSESSTGGLTFVEKSPKESFDPDSGMVAFATTSYNTGWMHGDIKGAFLSDTSTASVTGTELVTNGTFASGTTGWTAGSGGTISVTSGVLRVTNTATNGRAISNTFSTIVGKRYVLTADGVSKTTSNYYMEVRGPEVSTTWASGTGVLYFTAVGTTTYVELYAIGSGVTYSEYDNVSVRIVEDDRSVNNKGLAVYGTITKTAVATGADLVAYSGFNTTINYLQQPYNSALSFGTNDFSVTLWYYNNTSTEIRVQRTTLGADGWALTLGNAGGDFYIHNGNFTTFAAFTGISNTNVWNHWTITRIYNDKWYVYKNGVLAGTTTTLASTNFNDLGTFLINAPSGNSANSISLVRISQSVPSPDQIKKIYNDEKVLFQENSKATLYGTSSAVTALAYDDSTRLLYAGTSSGRSDFQGLERINNTTTAVTTAISASNGLIAEQ